MYDNASIVGRKIYLGWPYFAWSQGYDTDARYKSFSQILERTESKQMLCPLLTKKIILTILEISGNNLSDLTYQKYRNFFYNLKPIYKNSLKNVKMAKNYSIYKVI